MLNNPAETGHGLFGSLWRKLRNVFVFFFDRLIVIDNGHIVADGPKEQVVEALRQGRVGRGS
jgi:ABC-type transport system involved in cytochrome bd biosynthesis fused ATPase/permease subunit